MPLRIPGSLPVRLALSGAVILSVLAGGLYLVGRFWPSRLLATRQPEPPKVEELKEESKDTVKWKTRYVTIPGEIRVIEPTAKEVEKFERETGIPLGEQLRAGDKLLAFRTFESAPYGGSVEARLQPDGMTGLTISRTDPPRLVLGGPWSLGAAARVDTNQDLGWEVSARKELLTLNLRRGRSDSWSHWHLEAEARLRGNVMALAGEEVDRSVNGEALLGVRKSWP